MPSSQEERRDLLEEEKGGYELVVNDEQENSCNDIKTLSSEHGFCFVKAY